MKRLAAAIAILLSVYIVFNLTIGRLLMGKVRDFDETLSRQAPATLALPMAVDSSVCVLLADRGDWRGQLQAFGFPMAARAADNILKRYTFQLYSSSPSPMHCVKYNNRIVARPISP